MPDKGPALKGREVTSQRVGPQPSGGEFERLETRAVAEPDFEVNWKMVRDWTEASRDDPSTTEAKATDLLAAVTDPTFGVLPWLKNVW